MEYYKLNNGLEIPKIGFGTYILEIDKTYDSIKTALESGYRMLDCAKWYNNEEIVGKAIKDSKVKREDLIVTVKFECDTYENTIRNFEDSLKKIQLDYIDIALVHWPTTQCMETYQALEDLYEKGSVKAIGVSNYHQKLMDYLLENCRVKPTINQIEMHIYFQEKKMKKYLDEKNIFLEGWAPFAEGYMDLLKDKTIAEIAKKYKKTPAQIMLRFMIEKNIIVIPKSTNPEHIKENLEIFDFQLKENDVKTIEKLDQRKQYSDWPYNMKEETDY